MAVLHMCFELTKHGNSVMGILRELSRALRKDLALLKACLPSLALLAQASPQHAADAIVDEMLSLCTGLDSLPPSLTGSHRQACLIDATPPMDCEPSRLRLICSILEHAIWIAVFY